MARHVEQLALHALTLPQAVGEERQEKDELSQRAQQARDSAGLLEKKLAAVERQLAQAEQERSRQAAAAAEAAAVAVAAAHAKPKAAEGEGEGEGARSRRDAEQQHREAEAEAERQRNAILQSLQQQQQMQQQSLQHVNQQLQTQAQAQQTQFSALHGLLTAQQTTTAALPRLTSGEASGQSGASAGGGGAAQAGGPWREMAQEQRQDMRQLYDTTSLLSSVLDKMSSLVLQPGPVASPVLPARLPPCLQPPPLAPLSPVSQQSLLARACPQY